MTVLRSARQTRGAFELEVRGSAIGQRAGPPPSTEEPEQLPNLILNQQGGAISANHRPNAGIDVSKAQLDVCIGVEDGRTSNDEQGWAEIVEKFRHAGLDMVVV